MSVLFRTKYIAVAILALTMVLCSATTARGSGTNRYGDVVIQVTSPPNTERVHGYNEYQVAISNLSERNRHEVRLTLPEQSYFGGTVTRTVTVEPLATARVSMFISIAVGGNGAGVEIDGQPQQDVIPANFPGGYSYQMRPSVLISQGASSRGFQVRAAAILKDSTGKEAFSLAKADLPVAEWGGNWLGYSSFDGIVVTGEEMRSMPEPVSSALVQYVECGGALLVIGSWEPPQVWRTDRLNDAGLSAYFEGFGVCMVSDNAKVEGLTEAAVKLIGDEWEKSQKPWSGQRSDVVLDKASANRDFPVTENVSVPVRGLLIIMLIFVVVIGPVNLLVLSKKKKRMWLWWTVPLISVITCVAVSAYSILSEGWGGRARYLGITVLDERSHRASTVGINAFYSPLTPGDGLRYGTETEITSQAQRYGYSSEGQTSRTADWTTDQHLETGWVTARTPAHFMVRRNETRRERLTVTREKAGTLSVVNGLGVYVTTLYVADEKGIIYAGSNIAPGASAVLEPTALPTASAPVATLRHVFGVDWPEHVGYKNPSMLRPRTYLAAIDTCPFLEEGLAGVKYKKCEGLIYGIMKRSGDED